MRGRHAQFRLAVATSLVAWLVIMLGAYVRLSDAGLGCPDWPGCYGRIIAPSTPESQAMANQAFPHRPVESGKAWKEMIHRYAAGVLGLLIAALAAIAWRRRDASGQPLALSLSLLGLVIFQALLGMWTVTMLLKPAIVTLHLLGGMATLALLCWLSLRLAPERKQIAPIENLRPLAIIALVVLGVQIMLGGWTSTNYAAFFCPDFPTCQGQWLPPTDFAGGFKLWHQGVHDYEGGILSNAAGVAVQLTHRLGAVATLVLLSFLGARLAYSSQGAPRLLGLALIILVFAQFALGVANVLLRLPLPLAVGHNGLAALLLTVTVSVTFLAWSSQPAPKESA